MFRSAVLCLFLAAAILPDLAAAQSDWNTTDLADDLLIGIIVGSGVLFFILVIVVSLCCCCFLCPGMCGGISCFGQRQEYYDDTPYPAPYIEPPPPLLAPAPIYYPPALPEPEPLPLVISQPRREPEPTYVVREPEPRRERTAFIVRDSYDRDRYSYNDRRVLLTSPGNSRYERDYDYRGDGSNRVYVTSSSDRYNNDDRYDDRRYRTSRYDSPRRILKNDYY